MMSPQAIIALTSALIGLSACSDKDLETAIAAIKGDQIKLDQLNQDQDGRIAALYAQVSSQESTSSSSSIAASQVAVVQEPSSSVAPEPPREACTANVPRLYDCIDGLRYYW